MASLRNVTPLMWALGIMVVSNVITAAAALYLVIGTPRVHVVDGIIETYAQGPVPIKDNTPVRVRIVP